MAMSLRQDLLYLQGTKFHHLQKLLLLLQREMHLGLTMLVQMLKKMGQSVQENVYIWYFVQNFCFVFIYHIGGFYFGIELINSW